MINLNIHAIKPAARSFFSKTRQRIHWLKLASDMGKEAPPVYPTFSNDGLKLHIGSGSINVQGWINIDARAFPHTHIVTKGFDLSMFSDGSVSQIYLCHVLEHFSYHEVEGLLANFLKKLQSGGRIYISVPDFQALVAVFSECNGDLNVINSALMGGQEYEYNFHRAMFTAESLGASMKRAGFSDVAPWKVTDVFGVDVGDWSSRTLPTPNGRRFISLNLMGVKG
jgi:predicted SAM-dependent methyltransferase